MIRKQEQTLLSAKFAVDLGAAGVNNAEYATRIEAARVTAQFRVPIAPTVPQNAIEDLPLFGGERQGDLF